MDREREPYTNTYSCSLRLLGYPCMIFSCPYPLDHFMSRPTLHFTSLGPQKLFNRRVIEHFTILKPQYSLIDCFLGSKNCETVNRAAESWPLDGHLCLWNNLGVPGISQARFPDKKTISF